MDVSSSQSNESSDTNCGNIVVAVTLFLLATVCCLSKPKSWVVQQVKMGSGNVFGRCYFSAMGCGYAVYMACCS